MTERWAAVTDQHATIWAFAGPLAKFLNGQLDAASNVDKYAIWFDAFDSDWPGDLAQLPSVHLYLDDHFRRIRSKSMYTRVAAYINYDEAKEMRYGRRYYNRYVPTGSDRPSGPADVTIAALTSAPMANVWLDMLASRLQFPIALAHAAIDNSHLALLRYLVQENLVVLAIVGLVTASIGCGISLAMDVAAARGDLEMLMLLHDGGCNACSVAAMDSAAKNGRLDIVTWLHGHRDEGCSPSPLDQAILQEHADVEAYLRSHCGGAEEGKLDLVTYLDQVCRAPCSTYAMDMAAGNGHLDVVRYLHAHRTEGCTTWAMDRAAYHGRLDVLRFLHANRNEGCSSNGIDGAARANQLEAIQFLTEHRTERCSVHAMDRAAFRGFDGMVRYLHQHRTDGCSTRAIDWAASEGHVGIVQFLLRERNEGFSYGAIYWASSRNRLDVLSLLLQHDPTKELQKAAAARLLAQRHRDAIANLKTADCVGTETIEMETIEWDPNANTCVDIAIDAAGHEDVYNNYDSDDSGDCCSMFEG